VKTVYGGCSGPAVRCGALRGGWAGSCGRNDRRDDVLSGALASDGSGAWRHLQGPSRSQRRTVELPLRAAWMAQRPIRRGHLRLVLVSCPVALFSAVHDRASIKFNLINSEAGNRIRMLILDADTEHGINATVRRGKRKNGSS
jgi:hypothetical protein